MNGKKNPGGNPSRTTPLSEYTLTRQELTQLRAALTRAINSKDPHKVIAAVAHAKARFDAVGWPDQWSNWQRAEDDARFQLQRANGRIT